MRLFSQSRRSLMPRRPFRGQRCKPLLEALEERAVPALLVSGDPTALEGTPYVLSLPNPTPAGVIEYTIDWGDGATEHVAVAALPADHQIEHVYADGPNNYTITVQSIVSTAGPSPDAGYFFEGIGNAALNEASGGTPLTKIGTGGPVSDTVNGETTQVWQFGLFSGFRLDMFQPGMAVLDVPTEYTIEMVFQFDNVNAWRKILDFDNLNEDSGLYVFSNRLQLNDDELRPPSQDLFYELNGNTPVPRYNRVVLTRSAADGQVRLFLNGNLVDSYVDTGRFFDIGTGTLHFFVDDMATGGGETSSGKAAQIRVFDTALSIAEVQALGSTSGGGSGAGDSATWTVQVDNVNPVYTPAANQSGFRVGEANIALGSFADLGLFDNPWSVNVSWGDGSPAEVFTADAQGALGSRTHNYATSGLYTVEVTVTDKDGGAHAGSFQVIAGLVVVNTSDSGFGSLRAAIDHANALSGPDVIEFKVDSGAQTIVLASALPAVTEAVVFDGSTQPGFAGAALVSIDGGGNAGLDITGGDSTVRGLGFDNFTGAAINLAGGGNNQVLGNRFGPGIAVAIHGLSAGNVVGAPGDGANSFDNAAVVFVDAGHVGTLKVDATDDGFLEVSKDTVLVATLHGVTDVRLQADGGIDTAVVVGTSEADDFEIHAGGAAMNGVSVTSSDTTAWLARGREGKDTFDVVDAGAPFTLRGGAGADRFSFQDGAGVTGVVDGGAGDDVLDYSAWTSPVNVDLGAGTATGTGGVVNIGHVIGGSGNDCLIGDDDSNVLAGRGGDDYLNGAGAADVLSGGGGNDILLGGAGSDFLSGGGGRDLLIGGTGFDWLEGDDGSDLLIGGATVYDGDRSALEAIMAVWAREDLNYKQRVRALTTASCEWCEPRLSSKTVIDDCSLDVLRGGDGNDLFGLGKLDLPLDWNPFQEFVFQYRK